MIPDIPSPHEDLCCPNCSTILSGPYCSSCGQRQLDLDRPFRELVGEAMESFLSFDARILRTLWPLVRRPGLLTVEFLAGRRARYVHPFKLYFAFSVLLFVALALSGYSVVRVNPQSDEIVTGIRLETGEEGEEEDGSPDVPEEQGFLDQIMVPIIELADSDPDRLNRIFIDRLAKSIIILVPVFAALLRVLYWKRRYIAHLVFSLHVQSFAFLATVAGLGFDRALGAAEGKGPGNAVAVMAVIVYNFIALRRVYGQGRFLTAAKLVALLLGYLIALLVTMILTIGFMAVTV